MVLKRQKLRDYYILKVLLKSKITLKYRHFVDESSIKRSLKIF